MSKSKAARSRVLTWAAWLLLAGLACQRSTSPVQHQPATVAAPQEPRPPYDRRSWRHWIDADGDCQDTRAEVLIAESEVPVTFSDARGCRVKTGRWRCPYTGALIVDASLLDVDHVVPLHEAHAAGGWHWPAERKRAYANDLSDPEHLVAVARSANRAKGSKRPGEWLPADGVAACRYVSSWKRIKSRWGLESSAVELQAIQKLSAGCPGVR